VNSLKSQGWSGQRLADHLNATWPFSFQRFPVAVAPSRFGDDFLPVMVDAATVGHAADHRRVPDTRHWGAIGQILIEGLARLDETGTARIYDPATRLFLVMERLSGAWRIRTIFTNAKPGYFAKQPGEDM